MNELTEWLSANPVAGTSLAIGAGFLAAAAALIYTAAFFQGREVSFWPPKLGPRPPAGIKSTSQGQSRLLTSDAGCEDRSADGIEQPKNEHSHKNQPHPNKVLQPIVTPKILPPPPQLSAKEEREFLEEYPEWSILETEDSDALDGTRRELSRVYEFHTFGSAFRFMTEVVKRGIQKRDHHPRWQNTYNRVEVWLTTFNLKYRPSARDLRLAQVFEKVWREQLKDELKRR